MKILNNIALISAIILINVCAYAAEREEYKYQRGATPSTNGFVLINLDDNILNNTQNGLGDIRVFDGLLKEIPYKLYIPPVSRHENYNPTMINSGQQENEFNSITFDIGKNGLLHNKISLSPNTNEEYISRVKLYGSSDGVNWLKIKDDRIINLKSPQNITINEINYDKVSYRYLKVNIYPYNGVFPQVRGATIYFEPDNSAISAANRYLTILTAENTKEKRTVITTDTGAKDLNINAFELFINGKNYKRNISIEGSYDKKSWFYIGSGDVFNYQWENYYYNSTAIAAGNTNARYFRFTIDNYDNEPLNITNIKTYYTAPQLLFEAEKNNTYTVYYGNTEAFAPNYDLSSFAHLINTAKLPQLAMSEEAPNKDYKAPEPPQLPWSEQNKWILTLILIITVGILGVFMFRSLRQETDKGKDDEK